MNNKKSSRTGVALGLTLGVIVFIGVCINTSKPKCSQTGCNEERTSGSQYCVMHDLSYRSYGNPDYNEVYRESQERQKNSSSGSSLYITDKTDSSSSSSSGASSSGTLSSGYKYSGHKSSSVKVYDPYDVEDYDDPDDFAEEWAEEFGDGSYDEGYDDAYDYWEEEYDE